MKNSYSLIIILLMIRASVKKTSKIAEDRNELPICGIPIVKKLKVSKGMTAVKKLLKFSTFIVQKPGSIIDNPSHETFLVLMLSGLAEVSQKSTKVSSGRRALQKNSYSHILVDSNTERITFLKQTQFYRLNQKYIYQIFQGVMSFPYIDKRLDNLKLNSTFNFLQKTTLVKIAFGLQQMKLRIGNILEFNFRAPKKESFFRQRIQTEGAAQLSGPQNMQSYFQEIQQYCYYIVQGEVQSFQHDKPMCLLGKNEILSNFGKLQQYFGKVTSEFAFVYKIKQGLILDNIKITEFENKRIAWRANRIRDISLLMERESSKIKLISKSRASFLEKQKAFKNIYGHSNEEIKRLEMTCKDGDFKCENRQQFYSKKLDRIMELQKIRYGEPFEKVVLFPMPVNKTMKKLNISHFSSLKQSPQITQMKRSTLASIPKEVTQKANSRKKRVYTESNSFDKRMLGTFFATGTL